MKNVPATLLASFALLAAVVGTAGAVTPAAPHDSGNGYSCATCHTLQKTLGSTGYNNICLSCHQPGDPKGGVKPFTPADAADPFGSYTANRPAIRYQTSHRWDGPDTNPKAGAQPPVQAALTTSGMRSRTGNQLACVRCHDQHSQTSPPFLRVANNSDQLCLDCHRSRNRNSAASGTHPIGVTYATAYANMTAKLYPAPVNANPANPSSAMRLNSDNVLCSTCHGVHYSDGNSATYDSYSSFTGLTPSDGNLLRTDLRGATANAVNICTNCHKGKFAHDKNGQNVQCTDCHGGHVDLGDGTKPNSNLVKRQMTFSSALGSARHRQAGFSSASVKTYLAGGNGVCEVCHTVPMTAGFQTFHGPPTTNPLFSGTSTGTCNQCHEHGNPLGSFAVDPTKACNACHGYPPISNTVGAGGYAFGYQNTASFSDESQSGHTSHASTPYQKACNECHSGNNHMDGVYQDVFLSRGPIAISTGTTPTYNKTAQTCSNVYCHSNAAPRGGTQAFATVPPWSKEKGGGKGAIIGQAAECGFCHSRAGDATPTWSASHTRHINGYSANAAFTCAACHAATASGNSALINTPAARELHTNGVKNVTFGTIAGSGSWDATAATCTNVYCHSTVQGGDGLSAATFASPVWNGAAMNCGSCHAAMIVLNAVTSASGSHKRHVQGYSIGCAVCHGSGYTSSSVVIATHVDKTINISFTGLAATNGATPSYYQGSNAPGTGYDKCSTVYCHSTVQANGGAGVPGTFATPTWGSGPLACGSCHVNMATSTAATGSHQLHANTAGYACSTCHSGAGKDPVTGVASAKHADGSIDIAFSGSGTGTAYSRGAAHAPGSGAYGSCSTSTCHGSGAPAWGANTTKPECEKCHGSAATNPFTTTAGASVNTDPKAGAHTAHLQSSHNLSGKVACAECHTVPATVNAAGHMNGTTEVPLAGTLARTGGLTPSYTPGTGTCASTYCHGASMPSNTSNPPASRVASPAWSSPILTGAAGTVGDGSTTPGTGDCSKCHGYPPMTGTHAGKTASQCTSCHPHVNAGGTGFSDATKHINGVVDASGGHAYPYPGATHRTAANAKAPYTNCSGCHDTTSAGGTYALTGHSGNPAPACSGCHTNTTNFTGATPGCWDCHGSSSADGRPSGSTYPNNAGSHPAHNKAYIVSCSVCHNGAGSGTTNHGPYQRTTSTVNVAFLANPAGSGASYTVATQQCSTIICHGGWPGSGGTLTTPVWGLGSSQAACGSCHGIDKNQPPTTNNHVTHINRFYSCATCHGSTVLNNFHIDGTVAIALTAGTYSRTTGIADPTAAATATCNNTGCHPILAWNATAGTLKCIDCHALTLTRTKGRPGTTLAPVTGEFGLAWGHKKTGRGAVTDADCIVCHLEGNFTTQKTSSYHADGNIDLRDPDGAGETPITNISGGLFVFSRFSTSYAAGSRTTTGHTSNTDIANVITQKFCIACHDSNGATNITARSNNGGTGTAMMPFGGINLGATYTILNGAAAAGGLVDVKTQFATTNSSYHPVIGPRTKDFPTQARLQQPYNNFTRAGTSGTKTAGVVMNCFDCHNKSAAPLLTTRTVSAHGNAETIRGTLYAATTGGNSVTSPTFCLSCHIGGYDSTAQGHGAGSAISASDSAMTATQFAPCANCHFSSGSKPARPLQAADVHGFNGLAATGGPWTYGNANGMRPIAFIRNVGRWVTTSPRPYSATTGLAGTGANCGGNLNTSTGGVSCNENMASYTPGGAY